MVDSAHPVHRVTIGTVDTQEEPSTTRSYDGGRVTRDIHTNIAQHGGPFGAKGGLKDTDSFGEFRLLKLEDPCHNFTDKFNW